MILALDTAFWTSSAAQIALAALVGLVDRKSVV